MPIFGKLFDSPLHPNHYHKANGITPLLPPLAPFHSQEWPWRTVASDGEGPETLQEALKQK